MANTTTTPDFNYDLLTQAAVAVAHELVKNIPDDKYNADNIFQLNRQKAENVGHFTATIVETVYRRNNMATRNLQDVPPCGSAASSY